MQNTDLIDSHIIFVDIMGVGKKLGKEYEGLDLIVSIKNKYPAKKVVVYSSKPSHDIFHEANELVDKRILKRSGDLELFRTTAEELSKKCFNWDFVITEIYEKIENELPDDFDKASLERIILKSIGIRGKISHARLIKLLSIGKTSYDIIMPLLSLYISGVA